MDLEGIMLSKKRLGKYKQLYDLLHVGGEKREKEKSDL